MSRHTTKVYIQCLQHAYSSEKFFKIDKMTSILPQLLPILLTQPQSTRRWLSDDAICEYIIIHFPSYCTGVSTRAINSFLQSIHELTHDNTTVFVGKT